ncbi:hypothetical protein [Pseudomonas purpurea]|uniref:hypothetical protein n=1 Tax=Pseudomonas purpurea TaxID=3136737 RepID=UPI003266E4FE
MSTNKPAQETKSTGYFKASQYGKELFNITIVVAQNHQGTLLLEGIDFTHQNACSVWINPSTPSGEQAFVPDTGTRVILITPTGDHSAFSGTFNAQLDNLNEKYKMRFKLNFHGNNPDIEGELDITGLNPT